MVEESFFAEPEGTDEVVDEVESSDEDTVEVEEVEEKESSSQERTKRGRAKKQAQEMDSRIPSGLSKLDTAYFHLLYALHDYYGEEEHEDITVQAHLMRLGRAFADGNKQRGWAHTVHILESCLNIDIRKS